MSFNDNVQIDTSRVDTSSGGGYRGGGMGGGSMGGGPIMVGGGITGLIITVIIFLVQMYASGGTPQTTSNTGVNGGGTSLSECKTGADANNNVKCRMTATENALRAYWSDQPQVASSFTDIKRLALYDGSTQSACGTASNQVGPFYCPLDKGIYIDTGFFDIMEQQLGAKNAPLAQEYVMAHEYGHHIQDDLGVLSAAQQDPSGATSGGVRIELMADCFAGMWMNSATTTKDANGTVFMKPFTDAEIQDAIIAAKSVGDDAIQGKSGGVNPDSWTHGSSAQRMKWLQIGMGTNDINQCNTLKATEL